MRNDASFQQLVEKLLLVLPPSVVHPDIVRHDIARQLPEDIEADQIQSASGNKLVIYRSVETVGDDQKPRLDYVQTSIGAYETTDRTSVSLQRELNALKREYSVAFASAQRLLEDKRCQALYSRVVLSLADGKEIVYYYLMGVALPKSINE